MNLVTIKPRESFDVLVNPGMGWTTFFSFNGDEINRNYPEASIAYFRFYWDQLEPREGEYRWDIIDDLIATGRRKNQTIALRIMAMDGAEWAAMWREQKANGGKRTAPKNHRVPEWFRKLDCRGAEFFDSENWEPGTPPMWEPDYGDPIFLDKHGAFLGAMGARYDGHPAIDHVDLGSFGRWGEWHAAAVPIPTFDARKRLVDLYLNAFRKTPLLIPVADPEVLSYAVSSSTGWRADCLGDSRDGFFNPLWEGGTPDWNHMEDVYPPRLVGAGALKAWKRSPVAFESGWSIEYWYEKGWPTHFVFAYALSMHCSILNNKSRPIPEPLWPQVNEFSRKMGYRYVVRSLEHPRAVRRDEDLRISMELDNQGVAPCYRKYVLAFRLKRDNAETVLIDQADPRHWLPGRRVVQSSVRLPHDCLQGSCGLSVALLDPNTLAPAVKLAIEGRTGDGWHPLSVIEVT